MQVERITEIKEAVARVLGGTDILAAYAFGSRIEGTIRPDSDLDIGYYLKGYPKSAGLPVKQEMLLAARLSEAVGENVDLRNLAEAPLELRGRVLEKGVRVYSSDEIGRVGLERDLLARYHDYKPMFSLMHKERLARFAAKGD